MGQYKSGIYETSVKGNHGPINVRTTFSDEAILEVQVFDHGETAGLTAPVFQRIPQAIVAQQSLNIDAISGATVTSEGIIAAVTLAVEEAGGDVEALKNKDQASNDKLEECLSTDILVVGSGGAGLAAAISAYEHGAKNILVLEKLGTIGGSTGLSGGGIAAPGTKFQREAGIEDTKVSWMSLWKERQASSNPEGLYPNYEVVDKFMDEAIITTEWLHDYAGHAYRQIYGFGVDPVRRLHDPIEQKDGATLGQSLIQNLVKFLEDHHIELRTETAVKELIWEDGQLVGALAEGPEAALTIRAKKVILASGGFAKNEEMLQQYVPQAAGTSFTSMATPGATGDGILMALDAGATLYEEPWIIGLGITSYLQHPVMQSLMMDWSKVYVNQIGERFMNEQSHYAIAANQLLDQDATWLLLDSAEQNQALVEALETLLPSDQAVKAETIEALAEAMNVPPVTLSQTMQQYNEGAEAGQDAFGKDAEFLAPVRQSPFYAIKMYPLTMGTFGGVKTDEAMRVLKADGSSIENLYAVGETANKVLYNQVYMSGSAVQFALTSGRLSGEHAAKHL